ncbi:hypothetical protein [Magnetofaba australis]|uniref:Putative glycosyl transferase family 2 n=1 Tax=Magnetofaba australis IT-1 TaxID=1434232 RepID=A0A1Y2K4E6_9PROT|nr:hypothetical protein [Magnetofaba australis]OSM01915.1 putative glycosyl transferase family 2 [Magnetofaba australis IT-1]
MLGIAVLANHLIFAPSNLPAFVQAIRTHLPAQGGALWFAVLDEVAMRLMAALGQEGIVHEILIGEHAAGPLPQGARIAPSEQADLIVLTHERGEALADALMTFVAAQGVTILAPITERYSQNLPLWLISIPKAGTHLLKSLAQAFGYRLDYQTPGIPQGGAAYYLEHANSHTRAADFFVDSVRRAPYGNRLHPFPIAPGLFIYRNPLDILVSEAHYYAQPGKTPFHGYLSQLTFAQRIDRLIDDPWLLGSIRQRVGGFLPWLDFPNVISFSFEELIGAAGGGDQQTQLALIWSLQLKLQVPGSPEAFARRVFNPASPTFRQGRLGAYRAEMDAQQLQGFEALPQDFMTQLGYAKADEGYPALPSQAQARRQRPLRLAPPPEHPPVLMEVDYLGFNLVWHQQRYYALPVQLSLDLSQLPEAAFDILPQESTLARLKQALTVGPLQLERIDNWRNTHLTEALAKTDPAQRPGNPARDLTELVGRSAPYLLATRSAPELVASCEAFNIIRYRGGYLGVRHGVEIDWSRPFDEIFHHTAAQDLLRGRTQASVTAQIEQLKNHAEQHREAHQRQQRESERLDQLAHALAELSAHSRTHEAQAGSWYAELRAALDTIQQHGGNAAQPARRRRSAARRGRRLVRLTRRSR